ncbi:isochorismatase family protein [Apiospora phragmitis]|uniref:Isochorismatase family protein n=1 Tax=Apiospora phragmitis TaxID=2905665 RepID=A0ABR1VF74_9PEZI
MFTRFFLRVSSQSSIARGPWADEPWPLFETPGRTHNAAHPAIHIANEAAHTYNAMFRGINSIFLQAPFVTAAEDASDFLFLAHCLGCWITQHHSTLYSRVYPKYEAVLEQPGALTALTAPSPSRSGSEEDLSFLPVLEALIHYAAETQAQPQTYDPTVLLGILENLAPGLHAHAFAQIVKAIGMVSRCGEPGSQAAEARGVALLNAWRVLDAEAGATADRPLVLPMLVRLRDTTFEGGNDWPRLPVLAVHAIADRLSPAHVGAWRFLPCSIWGKPRELPFLAPQMAKEPKGKVKGKGVAWVPSSLASTTTHSLSQSLVSPTPAFI